MKKLLPNYFFQSSFADSVYDPKIMNFSLMYGYGYNIKPLKFTPIIHDVMGVNSPPPKKIITK